MKFPRLLHIAIEKPANDDPYLVALMDGIYGADETKPVALYKLVSVGRVVVKRHFESKDVK